MERIRPCDKCRVAVLGEIADRRTMFENIPSWYAQIIIPVGFGLLVVHFLIRAMLRATGEAPKGERL